MTHDHDVKQVLLLAAEADRPDPEPLADLVRARAAASARFRRRLRFCLAGTAVATVLGVASATLLTDSAGPPQAAESAQVQLVAEPFDASPYTFDLTPTGWSVQGQRPQAVTIAPDDGSTSSHPDDYRGKLVIMLDGHAPQGRVIDHEGRRFWLSVSSGYTTIATWTRADEPHGVVRIQFPDDAGWDEQSMVSFLASVHVGPGARPGLG
ncbi:hypothetical protein [Nocardioides sp.]|uniref:hypothetical protein n=1 Tax=Nocardioides sp. TaxID=35761 RepID=UPI002ED64829